MFKKNKIESEKVLALFKEEGPICNQLFCFETRPQQEGMLLDIMQAFNKEKIAFIEAGTGTGKSLAYLLPSLLVALHLKQRVVISTNTIALQEQLIKKDIPFIIDALNLEIRVELAKGMGNYLCLRKLKENGEDISFFKEEEMEQVRVIQEWSKKTIDGTKADLSFMPSSVVWEQVSCESDACNHKKCPFFSECFFLKPEKNVKKLN